MPVFPIISQWQLYIALATRVLIRLGQKTIFFAPPAYRCYMWNMARIGFLASEEMSFENIDDDRWTTTTDGWWMPAHTISSRMSLRLRWPKNTHVFSGKPQNPTSLSTCMPESLVVISGNLRKFSKSLCPACLFFYWTINKMPLRPSGF